MTDRDSKIKYLLFFVSAALFLMLASRSSFLYIMNNWDDANSYFSVGKALFNGKVPYRDVFDQKGMYLYLAYGLAYLVSHTSFLGVYFLETIVGFIDIIGFYKLIRLYAGEALSVLFAPVSFLVIVVSRSFWWGGAAEELCLPFYIYGMYLLVRYAREDFDKKPLSFGTIFLGGVFAGFVANIKFTGLGFFFGWMALAFLSYLILREVVMGLKACAVFLLGMFIPFVPWIVYFALNKSLYDWYWGYVYINVFLYPNTSEGGIYSFFYGLVKILYWLIHDNLIYFVPALVGILFAFLAGRQKFFVRLVVPVLFGFMFLGIFAGGRTIPYYALPLGVFAVFGFAFLSAVLGKFMKMEKKKEGAFLLSYVLTNVLGMGLILALSMNTEFLSQKKDFFLYRFRDEVLEKDSPTLLNVGCLDMGLYTLTDIVPSCRWFQTQTLDIPEADNNPYHEQEKYVREGVTDFVVARDIFPDNIYDRYELIDQAEYGYDGYEFTYYLFRLK